MNEVRRILWLFLAFGVITGITLVLLFSFRGGSPPPVILRLISVTNDSSGAQSALFCLSHQSGRTVTDLSDGAFRPYYFLTEALPLDLTNHAFLLTNHNHAQRSKAVPATLAPGSSVSFPVRVPAGATGGVLRISYLPQKYSEKYLNIDVKQPFESHLPK